MNRLFRLLRIKPKANPEQKPTLPVYPESNQDTPRQALFRRIQINQQDEMLRLYDQLQRLDRRVSAIEQKLNNRS